MMTSERELLTVLGTSNYNSLLNGLIFSMKWDGTKFVNAITDLEMVNNNSVTHTTPVVTGSADAGAFIAASEQYLSTPDTPDLSMGDIDMAVAIWVKMSTPVETNNVIYGAQYLSTGDQRSWLIQYDSGANPNKFSFQVSAAGNATIVAVAATEIFPAVEGTAYLIIAWHDATANKIYIQVNNGTVYETAHTGGLFNSSGDITIGAIANPLLYATASISMDMWKGRILTTNERAALWNGGTGSKYPFDRHTYPYPIGYDVFLIAGQSNASGRGENNQTFVSTFDFNSFIFGNDYKYHIMNDPSDNTTDQVDVVSQEPVAPPSGSIWPIVATGLSAAERRTVFVPCALGGSTIANWQPGEDHEDRATLYGSMVYRAKVIKAAGGVLRGVCWWQGEGDTGLTQATYNTALDTLANAIKADLDIPLIASTLQICGGGVDVSTVNLAINEAIADNDNVIQGPDISDIEYDENVYDEITYYVHIVSDAKLLEVGARWVTAIKTIFGWT